MHAIFTLEVSVGKFALHLHCTRFDTHLVASLIVEHLDFIAVRLAPAGLHTQQHIGPIKRFSTACTGIYIDNSAHLILLAAQHIA